MGALSRSTGLSTGLLERFFSPEVTRERLQEAISDNLGLSQGCLNLSDSHSRVDKNAIPALGWAPNGIWDSLWDALGLSWDALGQSWGRSWPLLGRSCGPLRRLLGALGRLLASLGRFLGASWAIIGRSWPFLGWFGSLLEGI